MESYAESAIKDCRRALVKKKVIHKTIRTYLYTSTEQKIQIASNLSTKKCTQARIIILEISMATVKRCFLLN